MLNVCIQCWAKVILHLKKITFEVNRYPDRTVTKMTVKAKLRKFASKNKAREC